MFRPGNESSVPLAVLSEITGVPRRTVYRWAKEGRIVAFEERVNGRWVLCSTIDQIRECEKRVRRAAGR